MRKRTNENERRKQRNANNNNANQRKAKTYTEIWSAPQYNEEEIVSRNIFTLNFDDAKYLAWHSTKKNEEVNLNNVYEWTRMSEMRSNKKNIHTKYYTHETR